MLMKWSDLEPGDVIKFTKEAFDIFGHLDWAPKKEIITLTRVFDCKRDYETSDCLRFYFDGAKFSYIFTDYDGKFEGITLFEIVSLKED